MQKQVQTINLEFCSLENETFEKTVMRTFLKSSLEDKDLLEKFDHDNSDYAFLSIMRDGVLYAALINGNWEIYKNDKKYIIKNEKIDEKLEKYVKLNSVYRLKCPDNYIVFDGNEFQSYWIKKRGELNFLYYSFSCNVYCLSQTDREKLLLLFEINETFNSAVENSSYSKPNNK